MKTMIMLCAAGIFFLGTAFAPSHKAHLFDRTSVNITESATEYSLTAHYPEKRFASVRECLYEYIKQNKSTLNPATIDAIITFEDKTTFYARSFPGELELKFDKTKNSREALGSFKKLCDKMKDVIGRK